MQTHSELFQDVAKKFNGLVGATGKHITFLTIIISPAVLISFHSQRLNVYSLQSFGGKILVHCLGFRGCPYL